jgi:hypothetical protein
MRAHRLTPILNVSNIEQSFAWFEKLGWKKGWDWGSPPTFGGVCSGDCEIFLCLNGQGGRGKSTFTMTFGPAVVFCRRPFAQKRRREQRFRLLVPRVFSDAVLRAAAADQPGIRAARRFTGQQCSNNDRPDHDAHGDAPPAAGAAALCTQRGRPAFTDFPTRRTCPEG